MRGHSKPRWWLAAGLACLAAPLFAAAPVVVITPSPLAIDALPRPSELPPPRPGELGDKLDYYHDRLFLGVQGLIERTDSRFSNDGDHLPVPVTPFRIGIDTDVVSHPGGTAINPRVDLDLQLQMPNMQRRLHLFITSDSVEEAPNVLGRDSSGVRAGVRLTPRPFLDFDIGIRADVPPYAFTSLRWLRSYDMGGWTVQPFSKLYYQTHRGLGLAAGISVDRWIGRWIARSSTYANWLKDKDDSEWTQAFTLARAQEVLRMGRFSDVVGGRDFARGFGVQLLASGSKDNGTLRKEVSVFYKHPTRTRWLYWHVAPLVRWERQYNWHPDPGINIGVDALFWEPSHR
jgi:hypothetical protein